MPDPIYKYVPPGPPPQEEPGFIQKWAPTVVRGASGLLGFSPWSGAAGGAGGEILAEMIERGDLDPTKSDWKRVAGETAVGGAMGGAIKAMKTAATVGRAMAQGATMGASAPVIRHTVEEGDYNPLHYGNEVGMGGLIGGVTGGLVHKTPEWWAAYKGRGTTPPPTQGVAPIVDTPVPVNVGRHTGPIRSEQSIVQKAKGLFPLYPEEHLALSDAIKKAPEGDVARDVYGPKGAPKDSAADIAKAEELGAKVRHDIMGAREKAHQQALDLLAKEKSEAASLTEAERLKEGLVKGPKTYVESAGGETPTGSVKATQRWVEEQLDDDGGGGGGGTSNYPPPVQGSENFYKPQDRAIAEAIALKSGGKLIPVGIGKNVRVVAADAPDVAPPPPEGTPTPKGPPKTPPPDEGGGGVIGRRPSSALPPPRPAPAPKPGKEKINPYTDAFDKSRGRGAYAPTEPPPTQPPSIIPVNPARNLEQALPQSEMPPSVKPPVVPKIQVKEVESGKPVRVIPAKEPPTLPKVGPYGFQIPEGSIRIEGPDPGQMVWELPNGRVVDDEGRELLRAALRRASPPPPTPDAPASPVNKYEMLAQALEERGVPIPEQVAENRMGSQADRRVGGTLPEGVSDRHMNELLDKFGGTQETPEVPVPQTETPPEAPLSTPEAPIQSGKVKKVKGLRVAATKKAKGAAIPPTLTPEESHGLKWIQEEMNNFGFTPGRLTENEFGPQYNGREAGAPVFHDITQLAGYNGTRAQVLNVIKNGMAGERLTPAEQKLFDASKEVANAITKAAQQNRPSGVKMLLPPEAGGEVPPQTGIESGPTSGPIEDILSTGEAQVRLPEAGKVRNQETPTPKVAEVPYSLTRETKATTPLSQGTLAEASEAPTTPPETTNPYPGFREVKEGEAFGPGREFKMDMGTGKNYVNDVPAEPSPIESILAQEPSPTTEPTPPETPPQIIPLESLKRPFGEVAGSHYDFLKREHTAQPFEKGSPEAAWKHKVGQAATEHAQGETLKEMGYLPEEIGKMSGEEKYANAKANGQLIDDQFLKDIARHKGKGIADTASPDLANSPYKDWDGQISNIKPEWTKGGSEKGEISPEVMMRLGLGAGGAVVGATQDKEHPFQGALIGGTMGALAPSAISHLQNLHVPEGTTLQKELLARVNNWQRASLLSNPYSLAYNAVAGPWGSNLFGGLEHMIKGKVMGNPEQVAQGAGVVGDAFSPGKWAKGYNSSLAEAGRRINEADIGRAGYQAPKSSNIIDSFLRWPAKLMTAGDINTRNILKSHGIPEALAERMTLTAEPRRALGKVIVNWGKSTTEGGFGSTLANMMLPFKRTAANILESGAERTPGLGEFVNMIGDPALAKPLKERMVEQGMGLAVFATAYEAGFHTPSGQAKDWKLYNLASNLGGQYAALSGMGFAMGQAKRQGKKLSTAFSQEAAGDLPVPTTEPVIELIRPLVKILDGEGVTSKDIPKSMYPKALTYVQEQVKKGSAEPTYKYVPPK